MQWGAGEEASTFIFAAASPGGLRSVDRLVAVGGAAVQKGGVSRSGCCDGRVCGGKRWGVGGWRGVLLDEAEIAVEDIVGGAAGGGRCCRLGWRREIRSGWLWFVKAWRFELLSWTARFQIRGLDVWMSRCLELMPRRARFLSTEVKPTSMGPRASKL